MPHPLFQQISSPPLHSGIPNRFPNQVIQNFPEFISVPGFPRSRPSTTTEDAVVRCIASRSAPVAGNWPRRCFDAICAAAGLAGLAPLFAMIAIAIKLDDGGPIFYSHARIGKAFRRFRLFKFRSMIYRCAEGSTVTAPKDARITRVGRLLRKYKLDELPQLWNVLKGDMQLVGARPQMQKFVDIFHDDYVELLQSAPGITDPASLVFRNEELFFHKGSIEEQYVTRIMPMKLQISIEYSRARTFLSDLEILFRTVRALPSSKSVWENKKAGATTGTIPDFIFNKASQPAGRDAD
jgi:lipopolysaccharide/colanic/teichoic acid biosynthesis glycosyltransferase